VIRFATAAAVCAVAAFAAVISYSHIYGLGRAHGQDGTAARLLPLSVDGLILAASLVLLHEARNDRDAPGLARLMLWLGIAATIGTAMRGAVAFKDCVQIVTFSDPDIHRELLARNLGPTWEFRGGQRLPPPRTSTQARPGTAPPWPCRTHW